MTPAPPSPALTRSQKEEAIRAACVRANPEIARLCAHCEFQRKRKLKRKVVPLHIIDCRPIGIRDVLLAIFQVNNSIVIDSGGRFWIDQENGEGGYLWDLRQDDLSLQSDACIDFLFDLLFDLLP